jgi:uncharacterized phage infection (PIP) family protein YhgE
MLFAMELHKAASRLKDRVNRWQLLGARSLMMLTVALIVSTVGSVMIYALGVHSAHGLVSMWYFQIAYVIAFLFVAQVPFFIMGDAGGWFNIAMLSTQLLTSGATIPRELLSGFYQRLGDFLPATYAVNGIMNLVTGGPAIQKEMISLLEILAAALLITFIFVAIWREKAPQAAKKAAQAETAEAVEAVEAAEEAPIIASSEVHAAMEGLVSANE